MSEFIIIEVDENQEVYKQADAVRRVADQMNEGVLHNAQFRTVYTENHNTLSDVAMAIRKYPNVHNAIHSLHGRITNGADIDQAIEWLYEELEE